MDLPDLRPLSFGELLDRTFAYYRRHFWLFVGIMAIPEALIVSIGLAFDSLRGIFLKGTAFASHPGVQPVTPPLQGLNVAMIAGMATMVVFSLIALLVYLIFYSFAYGATTFAVSDVHLGRPATARAAFRRLRGKYARLLAAVLLTILIAIGALFVAMFAPGILLVVFAVASAKLGVAAAILLGLVLIVVFIAACVFAIWFLMRFSCTVPALTLENIGAFPALGRSFKLTKGNAGRAFLIGILMYLVTAGVSLLLGSPFIITNLYFTFKLHALPPIWVALLSTLIQGLVGTATGPLSMIAFTLFYYDLRVRKEGFDLQAMIATLDGQTVLPRTSVPPGVFPPANPSPTPGT